MRWAGVRIDAEEEWSHQMVVLDVYAALTCSIMVFTSSYSKFC